MDGANIFQALLLSLEPPQQKPSLKITSTSVSNLDEAGLNSSDIGKVSSELVSIVVGSLGSGGISSSEIGGALDKTTAGAVDSLDKISGFDVSSWSCH